jgi:small-conductance mechanosensitive channel
MGGVLPGTSASVKESTALLTSRLTNAVELDQVANVIRIGRNQLVMFMGSLIVFLILAFSSGLAQDSSPSPTLQSGERTPAPAASPPRATKKVAKEHAEKVMTELTRKSETLGEVIEDAVQTGPEWLPEWVREKSFMGISNARYIASLLLLTLVAIFSLFFVRFIRKRAGRIKTGRELSWPAMLISAARKPIALLLWIYGVYFALGILFAALEKDSALAPYGKYLLELTYVGLTVATYWLIFRVIRGTERKMQIWADRSEGILDNVLVPVVGTALRLLVPIVGLFIVISAVELPAPYDSLIAKLLAIFFIGSVAYLIIRAARVSELVLLQAHRLDVADNLRAREIYTQVSVIRKIIVTSTIFLAVACMLMLFQPVRQFGTSILASAGIAGIVLGLAAQKTLGNLFAGIQIAISQPIRIDDVVIVEGEWGRIEEITLTFVTVVIWDLRRLVLPITYFIEKPFQNWTRKSADLLNSVFLYADYTLPIEPLRKELHRLLEMNPLWDKKAWVLQVTNSTTQAMEIRCLMTSSDAPKGWDLKCEIREGLIHFIQKNYPECLPRVRAELQRDVPCPEVPVGPTEKMDRTENSSVPGLDATAKNSA